jgi:hypothetical protein
MLFLYREQDIRFFGLCHDPGSDDAFPNLGKSNFDSGIDIGPCLVFYSSSSVSYHEKKARVVKIPAYRATFLLIRRGGTKSRLVSLFLLESFLTKLISN